MGLGTGSTRSLALGVHGGALCGAGNDHAHVDNAIALTKAGVKNPRTVKIVELDEVSRQQQILARRAV